MNNYLLVQIFALFSSSTRWQQWIRLYLHNQKRRNNNKLPKIVKTTDTHVDECISEGTIFSILFLLAYTEKKVYWKKVFFFSYSCYFLFYSAPTQSQWYYLLICSGVGVSRLWCDKAWLSLERTLWSLACSGHSVSARGKQWISVNTTHMETSQNRVRPPRWRGKCQISINRTHMAGVWQCAGL